MRLLGVIRTVKVDNNNNNNNNNNNDNNNNNINDKDFYSAISVGS